MSSTIVNEKDFTLDKSKIKSLKNLGIGLRVAVDFIDELDECEGVLVGNTNKGFILILPESEDSDYAPKRPFRVNCGSTHQYIYMGENKVKYLSDLVAGDKVPVISSGKERFVSIGRLKKEKREIKRIELENGVSASLQDVETLRFLAENSKPVRFVDCHEGDVILNKVGTMSGTHKGEVVDEYIEEI